MLFLIKYFIRHFLLFAFIVISAELGLALYSQYQLTPLTFWPALFTHFCDQSNTIIQRVINLDIQDFFVVKWGLWLFSAKPYYIVLVLIVFIVYFNLRQRNLQQPPLIKQPKLSNDRYQLQKKENTLRQVQKLKQSAQFQKYRRDVFFSRLPEKNDDQTVAELRQKETQFF